MGMGIDNGRKISLKILLKIKEYCLFNNLKLFVISEPGFEKFFKDLKKNHYIEILKNKNLGELCLDFRNAKLVIGYDSGPMHLATLCTQTLLLFSHTSIKQWGINIWHKRLKSYKFRFNSLNYILLKNKNLGSNKNNWIYYKNEIRCPIHNDKRFQNLYSSKNCCDLRLENIKEILQKIDI